MVVTDVECKPAVSGTHYVAIGSNLPAPDGATPHAVCERGLSSLRNLPGVQVQARSRWYSSAPVPASQQPRYVNGVIRLRAAIGPARLLALLQGIEAAFGRRRGEPNAARILDLDIIDMGGLVRAAPDPVLPHPRAHTRAFVLLPLRDVAPAWIHPVLGVPIGDLIGRLEPQDIVPL